MYKNSIFIRTEQAIVGQFKTDWDQQFNCILHTGNWGELCTHYGLAISGVQAVSL